MRRRDDRRRRRGRSNGRRVVSEPATVMGVLGMIELVLRDLAIEIVMIVVIVVIRDDLVALVVVRRGVVECQVGGGHGLHADQPQQTRDQRPHPWSKYEDVGLPDHCLFARDLARMGG